MPPIMQLAAAPDLLGLLEGEVATVGVRQLDHRGHLDLLAVGELAPNRGRELHVELLPGASGKRHPLRLRTRLGLAVAALALRRLQGDGSGEIAADVADQ